MSRPQSTTPPLHFPPGPSQCGTQPGTEMFLLTLLLCLAPLMLTETQPGLARLKVPDGVRDYYDSVRGGRRRGRQIVPGVYSCGHQGKDQFINFINPHYPSHDNVAGTCHFRMVTNDPGVCQIRVDFVDTELLSPYQGDCNDQYLIVSGSTWSTGFQKVCGINPDQHFYLHLDKGRQVGSVVGQWWGSGGSGFIISHWTRRWLPAC